MSGAKIFSTVSHHMYQFQKTLFNGEIRGLTLKLTAHLLLTSSQRMRGDKPLQHSNQPRDLIYRNNETMAPSRVQGNTSVKNPLNPDRD